MRIATIDLGTNTVRLLVAELAAAGRWRTVDERQQVTRLGEGLHRAGVLGESAMARTAVAVAAYVSQARGLGARRVRIVATSAVREAANGRAFVGDVEAKTGERVEVVSGDDEARLTILGVRRGLGELPGLMLTLDIGGGSTEFTLARDGEVLSTVSLRLGVVALAERFPFPGPVEPERYRAMADEIGAQLGRELPPGIVAAPPQHLVGTAGTVTTLAALDLGLTRYDAGRVQGHRLERSAVDDLRRRLSALTLDERAALPCLERGRADLIVPGVAIVLATMSRFGATTLIVSDWGLREGMMAESIDALS